MTKRAMKGVRCWWCGGQAQRLTAAPPPMKGEVPICGPENLDNCMAYMKAHDLKPFALVEKELHP